MLIFQGVIYLSRFVKVIPSADSKPRASEPQSEKVGKKGTVTGTGGGHPLYL